MLLLNRLGWSLETCAENFPCHQRNTVSNMYAKTSGRTWRIGGSQIWTRTGRDSTLCRVCWTHTQKCSRSVTTSTSPHPGKTGKDDDLGYLSMDLKSFYVQCTQGEVKDSDGQVKHRSDLDELLGMSTVSMDFDVVSVEGEVQHQSSSRYPTTQTLWCGACTDWLAWEPSGHHHDWPDVG